jgi:hypothetical protein
MASVGILVLFEDSRVLLAEPVGKHPRIQTYRLIRRTAVYGPVCTVVWERWLPPVPILTCIISDPTA